MATDESLNHTETLSDKSHGLIRRLRELISQLEEKEAAEEAVVQSTSVSDILDRFLLWCANLGALHKPTKKLSLDQRLADAPDVRDQILVNIADFNEAIEDLSSIILGDNPNRKIYDDDNDGAGPRDESDESSMDEAQMNLELMAEAMKALFQLAVLVRKSGPRDRFQRALQQSTSIFDESFDIDYVAHKYTKLQNAESQWLSKRLGSASAKRRQFIKYCREHKAHLDAHDDGLRDGATEKLSSKATTFVRNAEFTSLETSYDDADDAISIMTATTAFNADTKLKLPSLAELSPNADHFECPICFTLQSFSSERAWKIHAFRDLKAYVCTVGGAECSSLFFSDRNTWFEHELQNHRSQFNCTFCDRKGFNSKAYVIEHISSSHNSSPQDQLSALVDASYVPPSQFNAQDCPFCDNWAAVLEERANPKGKGIDLGVTRNVFVSAMKFKRHVATHQEQLAIFVLPRSSDADIDVDAGSGGAAPASLKDFEDDYDGFVSKDYEVEEFKPEGDDIADVDTFGSDEDLMAGESQRNKLTRQQIIDLETVKNFEKGIVVKPDIHYFKSTTDEGSDTSSNHGQKIRPSLDDAHSRDGSKRVQAAILDTGIEEGYRYSYFDHPSSSPPPATVASDSQPQQQKIDWPDSVRRYVERAFMPSNSDPSVSRAELETQLRDTITSSRNSNTLYTTDWDAMPLPQAIIKESAINEPGDIDERYIRKLPRDDSIEIHQKEEVELLGETDQSSSVPSTGKSKISNLAKHFEQLSQEFEMERQKDRQKRVQEILQSSQPPFRSTSTEGTVEVNKEEAGTWNHPENQSENPSTGLNEVEELNLEPVGRQAVEDGKLTEEVEREFRARNAAEDAKIAEEVEYRTREIQAAENLKIAEEVLEDARMFYNPEAKKEEEQQVTVGVDKEKEAMTKKLAEIKAAIAEEPPKVDRVAEELLQTSQSLEIPHPTIQNEVITHYRDIDHGIIEDHAPQSPVDDDNQATTKSVETNKTNTDTHEPSKWTFFGNDPPFSRAQSTRPRRNSAIVNRSEELPADQEPRRLRREDEAADELEYEAQNQRLRERFEHRPRAVSSHGREGRSRRRSMAVYVNGERVNLDDKAARDTDTAGNDADIEGSGAGTNIRRSYKYE